MGNLNIWVWILTVECWEPVIFGRRPSSYPGSPNLCQEAVVDCVGKPWIFIQCSCLIAPPCGYESALWKTWMLLPNAGGEIADWLLRGFIQCANIQVLIARSITASVHKFGGRRYDGDLGHWLLIIRWSVWWDWGARCWSRLSCIDSACLYSVN